MQRKVGKKAIVGVVTITNANIWEPISINGSKLMYTATILISKHDTKSLEGVNMAIEKAIQEGLAIHRGSFRRMSQTNLPLHDFTEDETSPFYGYYVINASSTEPPIILDHKVFPITDKNEVGEGSRVRVSLSFYPAVNGKKYCVGCRLGNIQKSLTKGTKKLPSLDFDWCHEEFLRILYESKLPT